MNTQQAGHTVRSEPARKWHLLWLLYVSGPSVLVVTPLVGLPFISDQRIEMYSAYTQFGVNPLAIAQANYLEIDDYIPVGNFRPIGRFVNYFEQAATFDVATATGLPPYVVQGATRLVMIALLSYTATYFISTLYRLAGLGIQTPELGIQDLPASAATSDDATPPPVSKAYKHCAAPVEIFPFLFAACLIVTEPQHPISFFPFLFISAAIAMLAIPLYIASHTALSRTRIKAREVVATILTGAAVAAFHDILFILPLVCLLVLLLRGWIIGITVREILRTNAFLRYLTFSCGFLAVFVPARIAIALSCDAEGCYRYANTELSLSGLSISQWIGRALSGLPREAIGLVLRGDLDGGLSPRGPLGLLSNTWTITVIALMLLLAVRAGRHLIHNQAQLYASGTPLQKDNANIEPRIAERRVGIALIIIGVTLIFSSTLLVSVTHGLQRWHEWEGGLRQWRDTLLVQIGWALTLSGALHLLFLALRKLITRKLIIRVAFIGIGVAFIFSSGILASRLLPSATQGATQGLRERYELGWGIRPFRDTLPARIGWALTLLAALYLLFLALRKLKVLRFLSGFTNGSRTWLTDGSRYFTNRRVKILAIAGSAAVLFGLTVFTFIANDRYAITSRYDPAIYDPNSHIDNLISVAVVDFDDTERGQHIRCQLIDAYVEKDWIGFWPTSRQIQETLNRLTRSEYGSEFCPLPP